MIHFSCISGIYFLQQTTSAIKNRPEFSILVNFVPDCDIIMSGALDLLLVLNESFIKEEKMRKQEKGEERRGTYDGGRKGRREMGG